MVFGGQNGWLFEVAKLDNDRPLTHLDLRVNPIGPGTKRCWQGTMAPNIRCEVMLSETRFSNSVGGTAMNLSNVKLGLCWFCVGLRNPGLGRSTIRYLRPNESMLWFHICTSNTSTVTTAILVLWTCPSCSPQLLET